MTTKEFALQAAAECGSAATSPCPCKQTGKPFWNTHSFQFMYVPAFQFQPIPGKRKYRYTATDELGGVHSFEADSASAVLEPIWAEIPEGVVTLTVHALDAEGKELCLAGARTFFKLAPFPEDLPAADRTYREAAEKAVEYALNQTFLRHWLTDGTPDPDYDHNVYPSKMIASIISAMIKYARLNPENAGDAMKIAVNAADYLLGITAKEGPMAWIPPTYQIDFRPNPETRRNLAAAKRIDWVMMIYPPTVGISYLELYGATGDRKYYDAALKIAEYFRDTVEENGSWYLIRNIHTGEVLAGDYCDPLRVIVPFLMMIYEATGEAIWKTLADNAIAFVEKTEMKTYDWGGQFEDSNCSVNYSNLTHYGATALIHYYCKYFSDDEEHMKKADDLMRFVEDQFVIWKRPSPWNKSGHDPKLWVTPCGLEQYNWHVPIDASTADIMSAFLEMYRAGRGDLHLEKAKALGDSLTRLQRADGMIPTHWMNEKFRNGDGLWINCLFYTAKYLAELAEFLGE